MKKIFFSFFLLPISAFTQHVGIGTATPTEGSMLDIDSGSNENLSVRFPIVKLDSITDTMGFSSHQAGFVAYNIKDTLDVRPGLYQNNGSRWLRLVTEEDVDSAYDVMDENVTLTSSTTYTELMEASLVPSSEMVRISVNLAGSGFVSSVQAIVIEVSIRDKDGVEIDYFAIAPRVQDKSDSATAIGWSASLANHVVQIPGYTEGETYTFVVQAKVGLLSGIPYIAISTGSHPYHLGSLFVEKL